MKQTIFLLAFIVVFANSVFANSITINSVIVEPSQVEPGNTTRIRITLENQGKKDLENIRVALDLSSNEIPFIPIESAAQKIIDEIEEDESENVEFNLVASPDAKAQLYKIPITLSYLEDEQLVSESSVIGLEVKSLPILEVAIEESEIYKLNQQGQITVRFVNKGLSDIKFLSVKLKKDPRYEILSSESSYVGNIEPDDFETVIFELNFNSKVKSLPVEVEYRDTTNKLYRKNYNLSIKLYTQEEAISLGLEKKNNPWVYVIPILIVIVIFFIFRRRRKKSVNVS